MDKNIARGKYDKIVKDNIEVLNKNSENTIKDPDRYSSYDVEINGLRIALSQDGICSFRKIKEFSNDKFIINNYELIRKDMFDCLCWPAYAMSINQMRSAKYKERLDLLFIDLYKFYEIVSGDTEISEGIISEIWEKCDLARAYVYPNTFYWLRAFGSFNDFINERRLNIFLEEENGVPTLWRDTGEGFCQEYFNKLIEKVKEYKNSIANISIAEGNSCK